MQNSEHVFSVLPRIELPGLTGDQSLIVEFTWVAMAVCVLLIGFVSMSMKKVPGSLQNVFESVISFFENYIVDIIGHRGLVFFPLVITIFMFIFVCNAIGLIPGFIAPTGSINTTAACAIVVFVFYQAVGIRQFGLKYFKRFFGPLPAIAPIMFVMEIISELARPFSLSVRLFANIMGGHLILTLTYVVPLVLPALWMGWESIITVPVQSFVFSLLTMIYLSGAISDDHGSDEHKSKHNLKGVAQ